MDTLELAHVKEALSGNAAAFRCVTELRPAGGAGDKVFPPTYSGGEYATELRHVNGEEVDCVLLDSVQSQANRMEMALLSEWEDGRATLPVITVDSTGAGLDKPFRVTSLEAPHRIADALLRDSELDGVMFRQSETGKKMDNLSLRNATSLFELCPTALVFGAWNSIGPRGGGAGIKDFKFQRSVVSEIIGHHATKGIKNGTRIDPAQISGNTDIYQTQESWTLELSEAVGKKTLRPSELGHGYIPLRREEREKGGFTISKAVQTTVLSLPALRRLRFPLDGATPDAQTDLAARTALAALALFAAALVREQGADLRSRCLLFPTAPAEWELLDRPGEEPRKFDLPAKQARSVYQQAVDEAKDAGLPWMEQELILKPSRQLLDLVRQSQLLAAEVTADGGEE